MEENTKPQESAELNLYVMSKTKLAIMCVATFGIYDIYWFYKNWKAVQAIDPKVKHPFWRAFFAIFYCYSFFKLVQNRAADAKYPKNVYADLLAPIYIVLLLVGNFWGRATITNQWLDLALFVITTLGFVPLLFVQDAINYLDSKDATAKVKTTFSTFALIVAILGSLTMLLAFVGTLFPE